MRWDGYSALTRRALWSILMTTKNDNALPYSLDEFEAELTKHLNRPAGFADAVRHLAAVRDASKRLQARRDAIFASVKEAHAAGTRLVNAGGRRWYLKEAVTPGSTSRTVSAAAVKKADPALWEQCRVPKQRVAVTAPAGARLDPLDVRLPALPYRSSDVGAAVMAYKSPLFDQFAQIKADEEAAVSSLQKIAADAGWDGEACTFTDGWKVSLVSLVFDGEKMRATDPETYERLSTVSTRSAVKRVIVTDYDVAVAKGEVDEAEADEIDGQ
ncbi:hypothetical protein PHELEMICH_63 [Mycobacterium phage Phelemich]|uniref:Uncharacterized protein n=1 Tax=Mycobacterium phage Phelemich TaxID=1383055 RepID=S5Y7S1_9CAUD|nr:hypothetical protein N847_gp63 [Mycobacterium phage Phelemich]AGT13977.1 hypothetical protein PHELEMICH_63 [Mycobacterium phage Phelemich]